jgi:hypothetical protein
MPVLKWMSVRLMYSSIMPLPAGLPAHDVVAIADANDQCLAWTKDLAKAPMAPSNTIPSHQLTTTLVGKNEVFVSYSEKHPLFKANSDNIAVFDTFFEINDFGTSFDHTGSRLISTPVSTIHLSLDLIIMSNYAHRLNVGKWAIFVGQLEAP